MKIKCKQEKKSHIPVRYSVLNEELDSLPIKEVYPKLIAKLQIDLVRTSEAVLRMLIAECPEDYRLAGYIYAIAREDYHRVRDEAETIFGRWATGARAGIAKLKQDKKWEGGVYTQDIDRYIAANNDDCAKVKEALRKAERNYKAARQLRDSYEKRLGALQTYARLVEKKIGLSVTQKHE